MLCRGDADRLVLADLDALPEVSLRCVEKKFRRGLILPPCMEEALTLKVAVRLTFGTFFPASFPFFLLRSSSPPHRSAPLLKDNQPDFLELVNFEPSIEVNVSAFERTA